MSAPEDHTVTLLRCQTEGCGRSFTIDENPAIPAEARSLKAALDAHKAGWFAAGGPVLCPDCAAKTRAGETH